MDVADPAARDLLRESGSLVHAQQLSARLHTSARARSALGRGVRYLHSDCTAMSRPILERSGLVAVTTTTPYLWRR